MSRFTEIVWLHGRDEHSGDVARLSGILGSDPWVNHHRPLIPDIPADLALDWVRQAYGSRIKKGSLLVGMERGGLIGCALQSALPALDLSVFAVNSPTEEGSLLAGTFPFTYSAVPVAGVSIPVRQCHYARVALYSSAYGPIGGRCDWAKHSPLAFDVPWLREGAGNAYYPVSYLVSAFMRGADMRKEVSLMFPATV
jgi:hypothetical protein